MLGCCCDKQNASFSFGVLLVTLFTFISSKKYFLLRSSEASLEPCLRSMMELFCENNLVVHNLAENNLGFSR